MLAMATASAVEVLAPLGGELAQRVPMGPYSWFRVGGPADLWWRPPSVEALAKGVGRLPAGVPLLALGTGSNLLIRDGGVAGLVVRLPKAMASIAVEGPRRLRVGAGALGISVAAAARDAGLAGLEFLRGIPGTIGGAVAMNAGAYGRETADILVEALLVTRKGEVERWSADRFRFGYRHAELAEGAIVVEALLEGAPGDPAAIAAEMARIAAEREASQPLRTRTGGSTFRNPPGDWAWRLVDAAGCRGLRRGGARVSEKHANFLIADEGATAADLEELGEEVRRRVEAHSGVRLEWEIRRVGRRA